MNCPGIDNRQFRLEHPALVARIAGPTVESGNKRTVEDSRVQQQGPWSGAARRRPAGKPGPWGSVISIGAWRSGRGEFR